MSLNGPLPFCSTAWKAMSSALPAWSRVCVNPACRAIAVAWVIIGKVTATCICPCLALDLAWLFSGARVAESGFTARSIKLPKFTTILSRLISSAYLFSSSSTINPNRSYVSSSPSKLHKNELTATAASSIVDTVSTNPSGVLFFFERALTSPFIVNAFATFLYTRTPKRNLIVVTISFRSLSVVLFRWRESFKMVSNPGWYSTSMNPLPTAIKIPRSSEEISLV